MAKAQRQRPLSGERRRMRKGQLTRLCSNPRCRRAACSADFRARGAKAWARSTEHRCWRQRGGSRPWPEIGGKANGSSLLP